MYCHRALGSNDLVESFPIGTVLAFDPSRGRLWAVCTGCGRWNLAPMATRWEAVETLDRLFRKASRRYTEDGVGSGPGIGVAEVEGTRLVQIGPDMDDELAAWRYGDEFRARLRTSSIVRPVFKGVGFVFIGFSGFAGGVLGGWTWAFIGLFLATMAVEIARLVPNPVVARVPVGGGEWRDVRRRDVQEVRLVPEEAEGDAEEAGDERDDEAWHLRLPDGTRLEGGDALEAAWLLLPIVNKRGGADVEVRRATDYVKKKGGTVQAVFGAAARRYGVQKTARLARLDPHIRMALEMLSQEESERKALEGELRYLARAWKEAEDLAEITDRLLLPRRVSSTLRRLREGRA